MRCRNCINLVKYGFTKPWGLVGYYFCIYHSRYMAANLVHCQCWRIFCLVNDFSIWYKTELNECLESITDTKCKTVSLVKKLHNGLFNLFISKYGCKELRRTFWFITRTESAWEHNNLCLADCLFKCIYRFKNVGF